jgi:23S rRNA pseudouridine1911/1915/1917 synthase
MPQSLRTVVADRGDAGVRLDLVLRRHLRDVDAATRTRVQAWIEAGQVTVNGAPVRRVSARAALGDIVVVALPPRTSRRSITAEDAALDILYEDDDLLALNKAAGIVVHPAFKHPAGTVMNALVGRARGWPAGQRPSIVGRLDKGTSGIVLVAKTAQVHAALQRAMTRAEKVYLAVVDGKVPPRGRIDLHVHSDPADRRRMVASNTTGTPSLTEFVCLARAQVDGRRLALVRCTLRTGRRHQIRAHLAARGWPIVGDTIYGGRFMGINRQALHAWQLKLVHPTSSERLKIEAPIPADMRELIARARMETAEITLRSL